MGSYHTTNCCVPSPCGATVTPAIYRQPGHPDVPVEIVRDAAGRLLGVFYLGRPDTVPALNTSWLVYPDPEESTLITDSTLAGVGDEADPMRVARPVPEGAAGQFVGYDASGAPVATDAPSVELPAGSNNQVMVNNGGVWEGGILRWANLGGIPLLQQSSGQTDPTAVMTYYTEVEDPGVERRQPLLVTWSGHANASLDGSIARRTPTGQIRAKNAVSSNELVTLSQMNTAVDRALPKTVTITPSVAFVPDDDETEYDVTVHVQSSGGAPSAQMQVVLDYHGNDGLLRVTLVGETNASGDAVFTGLFGAGSYRAYVMGLRAPDIGEVISVV